MRAVVDTNVVVSATLNPDSRMGLMLAHLAKGKYTFLYSRASLSEMIELLARPRISRGMVGKFEIEELVALIKFLGEEIAPVAVVEICRDPDDNKFLEIALTAAPIPSSAAMAIF